MNYDSLCLDPKIYTQITQAQIVEQFMYLPPQDNSLAIVVQETLTQEQ